MALASVASCCGRPQQSTRPAGRSGRSILNGLPPITEDSQGVMSILFASPHSLSVMQKSQSVAGYFIAAW